MIRTICIDTLTEIQNNEYMTERRKPGFDQWRDYGIDIYSFIIDIQKLGFEIIMILGEPGTGKSSGMRTLPHDTNIWYNADNKNPVWTGGTAEYGKKTNPRDRFHIIPKEYNDIINHIKLGLSNSAFEKDRYAFIIGHVETYKKGNENLERLHTIGKVASKMRIEGKMETVLYSRVEMEDGRPNFILETQNNGINTARSPMGVLDIKIPNDFNLIIEKLSSGY